MTARPSVAVVGQPGAWSTERLASALRHADAAACVVDLAACALALPQGTLRVGGERFPRSTAWS
jgi:hypothetical protein